MCFFLVEYTATLLNLTFTEVFCKKYYICVRVCSWFFMDSKRMGLFNEKLCDPDGTDEFIKQ